MKTCILFVLYNPDVQTTRRNIEEAARAASLVCLVDNSDNQLDSSVYSDLSNCHYHSNGGNLGVAAAYNYGLAYSKENGCDWLMTMDQDTTFPSDFVREAQEFIEGEGSGKKIGIVAPNTQMFDGHKVQTSREARDEEYVISSGSMTNVAACLAIGGFNEDLFIDGVDIDICWRLRLSGYSIKSLSWTVMHHTLGNNSREISLFGKHLFSVTNESPLRYYYIFRNYLLLCRDFKDKLPSDTRRLRKALLNMFLKMICFEPDKRKKVNYIRQGVKDFRSNTLGKIKPRQ